MVSQRSCSLVLIQRNVQLKSSSTSNSLWARSPRLDQQNLVKALSWETLPQATARVLLGKTGVLIKFTNVRKLSFMPFYRTSLLFSMIYQNFGIPTEEFLLRIQMLHQQLLEPWWPMTHLTQMLRNLLNYTILMINMAPTSWTSSA